MQELLIQIIRDVNLILMLKNIMIFHLVDQRYIIAIIIAILPLIGFKYMASLLILFP